VVEHINSVTVDKEHSKSLGRFIDAIAAKANGGNEPALVLFDHTNAFLWEFANHLKLARHFGFSTLVVEFNCSVQSEVLACAQRQESMPVEQCSLMAREWHTYSGHDKLTIQSRASAKGCDDFNQRDGRSGRGAKKAKVDPSLGKLQVKPAESEGVRERGGGQGQQGAPASAPVAKVEEAGDDKKVQQEAFRKARMGAFETAQKMGGTLHRDDWRPSNTNNRTSFHDKAKSKNNMQYGNNGLQREQTRRRSRSRSPARRRHSGQNRGYQRR
jgi:hypothetical protein